MGRPKGSKDSYKRLSTVKRSNATGEVAAFPVKRFMEFLDRLLIQSKDHGLVKFDLLGSQKYVLEEIISGLEKGVTTFVILKARQLGISTFFLALDLFWAFEYPGLNGVFATHDEGSRDQFRNQLEVYLAGLPKTHKWRAQTNNRQMLVLENLSVFRYLVAGTRSTTNKLGRSGGCNYAHCTEVAFWGSAEDMKALMQTFTETYPHRLYIFETTANGFNQFEEMWNIAKESAGQKAIFIGWWRDERNEFGPRHPLYLQYMPHGTKTPLTEAERRMVKRVRKLYDYEITAGQLAWYRYHLETKCSGDVMAMRQEMPSTEDEAFVATGSNFFASDCLTDIARSLKNQFCSAFVFRMEEDFMTMHLVPTNNIRACNLKIYEMPVRGAKYVIGADPIFGSSENRDNGVITVGRCYSDCIVQVAEYTSSSVSAAQFAWVIAYLCGLYIDVTMVLEITGPGAVVHQELKRLKKALATITPGPDNGMRNCLRHMRDFLYTRADSLTGGVMLQWKSTQELRMQLMFKFRDGITTGRLRVKSKELVEEMRHLSIDGGYVGVPSSKRDDRVFGIALMYWGWDRKILPAMYRMKGMTLAESTQREEKGDPSQIMAMADRFMRHANIALPE